MTWQTILAIGSGGFLGAVTRAFFNNLASQKLPQDFAYATLGVNLIGSLFMGALVAYFMYTSFYSAEVKSFLTTGFLGALTTYSAFAIESLFLIQTGHLFLALANVALNAFGTIFVAAIGFYIVKYLFLK